jgi:hypothetical protein
MAILLSACASAGDRLGRARGEEARADLVDEALGVAALPDLPADCRRREASGVKVGDRLDVALLKSERALGRANDRVTRCAGFYDEVRGRRHAE